MFSYGEPEEWPEKARFWLCKFSPANLWPVYVFSPVNAGSLASPPFADCVMLSWFHSETGVVVIPLVWVAVCVQLPFGVVVELFWPC